MKYNINWDMDSVFPGGSTSPQLQKKLDNMEKQLTTFSDNVSQWNWQQDSPTYTEFAAILELQEILSFGLSEAATFIRGLISADVTDKQAGAVYGKIMEIRSSFSTILTILTKKTVAVPDKEWKNLLSQAPFSEVRFVLDEDRTAGKDLLSEEEEALINSLSLDGFNGWGDHYNTIVSTIEIPFTEKDGTTTLLSAGQAQNKMGSDPDDADRQQIFAEWEKAWSEKSSVFSDTLNHLAGFRLTNYKLHGVTDFMKRPLEYNRMTEATLDTMWQTINKNKQPIVDYLNRKAALLGKEKLSWVDIEAPIFLGDYQPQRYPFDEGADFIVSNFRKFSSKMADFAQHAFDNSWIEAENRSGKRPGGYCANLPESGESRIFMTYAESPNEVSTLAHELGHAFHSHVMRDLPALNRGYAMNVAETASTFAELVISDATVQEAQSEEERINLLDNKIQRSATMFMNIQARFLFESRFYEERKKGIVTENRLNELMEAAQKEAFEDSLSSYHPTFWASKLHFFNTGVPFYNFPYTFGYLFSMGIYAKSIEQGSDFEEQYIALLKDTGSMTTENLALKHLNVDLTQPDFWQHGINLIHQDIQTFMDITQKYIN